MLAGMLPGAPVIAGKDRRRTGKIAVDKFRPDVIVLDDGMQFYQLHRELDIVLIDALRPFDNGWTFPRGLLREPPDHLSRTGCVVLTNVDKALDVDVRSLSEKVKSLAPSASIFQAQYEALSLRALDKSGTKAAEWLSGRKVVSFCALGNPEGFERQLARAGAEIVHKTRFPDHYTPTMGDLNSAIENAVANQAEAIIVTEKDAVKLPPLGRPLPFYAMEVTLQVNDGAAFNAAILRAAAK
jgi:tetraacyldisaccharide 4'-kinase